MRIFLLSVESIVVLSYHERAYSICAKPIRWKFSTETHKIGTQEVEKETVAI